jgi:hypothetical protein
VRPSELNPGRPKLFVDKRASAELLGSEDVVADTKTDDDFTAIALDDQGQRHVAWISYDDSAKCDQLWVRNVDSPASTAELAVGGGEINDAKLFLTDGALRLIWCSPASQNNWDIYSATRREKGWTTERLTSSDGTDFHLAADVSRDGRLWIAWQSFRNGNGDIYAKCLVNGRWSDEIQVTSAAVNEWQPSVCVDGNGAAWIAYDTYERGNCDVALRRVVWNGVASVTEPIAIAESADFEAHASVLADNSGRVWVAYDAAGPNWGKDFRNEPTFQEDGTYGEPLHATRRVELRCVKDGRVFRPIVPPPQQLPPSPLEKLDRVSTAKPARFYEYPQLASDGDGRMWLFFRLCRQGYSPHPPKGAVWEICTTSFTEGGWLKPIELPRSRGRQDQRVAICQGRDGLLQCAWADGNRFASVDRKYVAHFGSLPAISERAANLPLEQITVTAEEAAIAKPAVPSTMRRGDEEFRLYFGDLHRHTDISRCSPTIDGCLDDAHRYALDAVEYDFLAITNHERDVDPFSWWRTQKAADLYHIPGAYVPIYGYERSNGAPNGGHRNVFFLTRGAEINRSDSWYSGRNLPPQDTRPDTTLYPWMRQRGGTLTAAHTPEYSKEAMRGTWTYNDPQMEPITEIFQGFRHSYERPDQQVADEASVWHALGKGYRLGFIASSDHISTHTSYACVWATEKTREAIFEALSARRTFAATDRISLDFRIGDALMGEEVAISEPNVRLSIEANGTMPIDEIEIVRSGHVIATLKPRTERVDMLFVDPEPLAGKSYYYVRLLQRDRNVAWGSPVWVDRN